MRMFIKIYEKIYPYMTLSFILLGLSMFFETKHGLAKVFDLIVLVFLISDYIQYWVEKIKK